MSVIETRYFVEFRGELIPLTKFADMMGLDYERMRRRLARGSPLVALPKREDEFDSPAIRKSKGSATAYSLEELAEMWSRFRDAEDAMHILADLACLPRRSKAVRDLREQIEKYLETKYKEVHGK